MPSLHSLRIGHGEDQYDLPKGAWLIINRDLKSGKLDNIPVSDAQLMKLVSDATKYLSQKIFDKQSSM